jgi:hypothetical protein
MDADNKTVAETQREVEGEINAEEQAQIPSKEPINPEAQEAEKQRDEDLTKDEEFQKLVKEEEKEIGKRLSFGQSKRFKEIYWRSKESGRKAKELEEELEGLRNAPPPEIDDVRLTELAKEKGYTLTKAEKAAIKEEQQELEALLKDVQSPQEKEWWMNHAKAVESRIMKNIEAKYADRDKVLSELFLETRFDRSEKSAKKFVDDMNKTHGTSIDYAKDIDPEVAKLIKANPNISLKNVDLLALTKEILATKGVEIGKKLSSEEARKLNEEKKKANMETGTPSGTKPLADDQKSFKELMAEEMAKENA